MSEKLDQLLEMYNKLSHEDQKSFRLITRKTFEPLGVEEIDMINALFDEPDDEPELEDDLDSHEHYTH